jgi:hypothetical protein
MISRHPTTGKPIRILRSEATLSKNAKTVVWIEPTFKPSHRWSRWSTIISDMKAIPVLEGIIPSIVILQTAEDTESLKHLGAETVLFITETVEKTIGDVSFLCIRISDLNRLYPFIQESVNDKSSLEQIVSAICTLFRFQQLVTARESISFGGTILPVKMDTTDEVVPRTYWISQYYEPSHPSRARELRECIERNSACPFIDYILLLTEGTPTIPSSDKIILHPFGKRATYADTFQIAMDRISKGNRSILIFSNSDIWFDATLRALWSIHMNEKICLSLLRWEGDTIFGPRPDSQDTWILGRDALDLDLKPFQFYYGIPGCDNIVSLELFKQRFLIVNPAYTIKTYHNHASSIRSYNARNDILYNSIYLYVDPTAIQSFATTTSFGPSLSGWNSSHQTFVREVGFLQKSILTLPVYTPPPSPSLHHIQRSTGLFVSPRGLLYDFHTLWAHPLWTSSTLHTLAPTIHLPSIIALPGATMDPAQWMLQSFPQIFRIRQIDPTAHFSCPASLHFLIPDGVRYESDVQYWSQSVYTIPTLPTLPTLEDIQLLRSYFKLSTTPSTTPTIIFLLSDDLLPLHHAEQMYKMHCVHTVDCETTTRWNVQYFHPTDSLERVLPHLQTADWIVGETNHPFFPWSWNANPGATILEFQKEDAISSEIAHLAGAASLHYVMGVQHFREPVEDRRQKALVDLGIAIKKYGMKSRLKEMSKTISLPVITLPVHMTGIHVHSGDSFRAMIQLWKERGYCRIEFSDRTPFCWWNGVGETLLYDRDTMKWMEFDKPMYKLALIGNPSVTDRLRQSKWSYWTRYPQLVEQVCPLDWTQRTIASLFLGRIENGVQKKHRETANWKIGVELFECPIDSSGGPYKYSPSEYLDQLCKAKFGLCLAGFGQKCHREIEYYACGTVPIATSACDMTGYLHPPEEGIHFFRAKTPDDVLHIVKTTSRSTWERMSFAGRLWWKENASAEGLFRLTANRIKACLPTAGIGIPS